MSTTLNVMFSTVIRMPSRNGVRASPADRSAPPNMKNSSMPMLNTNMSGGTATPRPCTSGVALTRSSKRWRQQVAERREDAEREDDGRQERLIDRAVDLLRLVRTGKARHENAHAGKQRRDEDDHDEEDLPAHADRRIGGKAHVSARPSRGR